MKPEWAAMEENQHKGWTVAWMLLKKKLWAENPGGRFTQNPMQQQRNGECMTRKGKCFGRYVYYAGLSRTSRRKNRENKAEHTLKAAVDENFQEMT